MYSSSNSSSNSSIPSKISSPSNCSVPSKTNSPSNTGLPSYSGVPSRTNSHINSGLPSKTGSPSYSGLPSKTGSPSYSGLSSKTGSPSYSGLPSKTGSPSYSGLPSKTGSPSYSGLPSKTGSPSYSGLPSRYAHYPSKNDSNNNMNSPGASVKPPASVVNSSPYDHQLLERLVPRHITTEHVVFSHKTKVGGRSLYFFSPASRGGLTKPVFTTREKLTPLLDGSADDEDEADDVYHGGSPGRRSSSAMGMGSAGRRGARRREELSPGVVCTIKRVHLGDPACDLGVSVWRGRGPKRGLQGPQRPPVGTGPALLVETPDSGRVGDGMAIAAGYTGEVMYLLPYTILGRTDLEPRATEILVQDAMLSCVSESVVWFVVKSFTRRKVITNTRQLSHQKLNIGKLNLRSSDMKKSS
ncbi:uncharacterized protein LOC121854353 [Homarus americanus]|uniref:uncharacterized protein LOC121854353 n=1 Tax=Homarus americanus TaxID=6706 RepID=UPI001C45BB9C|nr:uncharacterized protein LOC121854353 [Homarus americanus]